MTTVRYVRQPRQPLDWSHLFPQILVSLLGGMVLFLLALLVLSGIYQVMYWGRIFPGVSVAGVDVSGLNPTEAALKLGQTLSYPTTGRIVFRDGENLYLATPAQLGMVFDAAASANSAYELGRSGGWLGGIYDQFAAWRSGVNSGPVIIFDQRISHNYLQSLSAEINRPMQEAYLSINGIDVVAVPGQIGRSLNIEASLLALNAQLQSFMDGEVQLVVEERVPEVLDVSAQAEQARRILSAPLVITLPDAAAGDPGPWSVDPVAMAAMMRIEKVRSETGGSYQLALDGALLQALLGQIAAQVDRTPQNPRFMFDDPTGQLVLKRPAVIGRTVQVDESLQAINAGLLQGQLSIPLVMAYKDPEVKDDATAEQLGITQLLTSYTSYFRGSTEARMQNIQTAAEQFYGVLVPPGAIFSMGDILGDVSLDNGYAEALIIYGGKTIKGVGGGVCQVSTTLFRAAFFAGFPIVERNAHAYRVSYYEQAAAGGIDPNLAGLDATVFFPLVDFKFRNDSPHWLLMETYFDPVRYTLQWKFYSTSDGRSVTWETTGPRNIVEAPEPSFVFNSNLDKKEFKQIDWAAEGADISVVRYVWRGDQLLFQETFTTHYEPWQAVYEYGPGIDDPKKEFERRNR